jgi:DNA repair protein RadC
MIQKSKNPDIQTSTETPHYHGHRDRLRQRFLDGGPEALPDYEMLELLLFMAIPLKDVKPLAKALLARFGNLAGVLNAPYADLQTVEGVKEKTAACLKIMQAASHRMLKQELIQQPVLNSWARLVDYCAATMAHEKKEHFRVLFLNKKNELIADEIQGSGTVDHTPAYPREIMKRALELGATALILVHNHPSGDPKPSTADVDMTYAIKAAGEPFNIVVHDHLIVSRGGTSSFKTMGLI